jgi:hypothetical protein
MLASIMGTSSAVASQGNMLLMPSAAAACSAVHD